MLTLGKQEFDDSVISGLKGTPHWMAQRSSRGQMTTGWIKADVWSVGCTVVEMVTGKLPFSEYDNPMTAMYQMTNGEQPPLPEDVKVKVSEGLKAFISACSAVDPNERPEALQLKSMPFPARNKGSSSKKKPTRVGGPSRSTVSARNHRHNRLTSPYHSNHPTNGAGSVLTRQTTQPTLTSTPSEALVEAHSNPHTREQRVAT